MNKIIIGALVAIIAWEIGAYLAKKFETKVAAIPTAQVSSPARKAPESPGDRSPGPQEPGARAHSP